MKTSNLNLERRRVRELVRSYTEKGYRVLKEPGEYPDFLAGLQPDLVAISKKDKVVIEVTSYLSLKKSEKLRKIAEVVENQPKWRFELVVTNPQAQGPGFIEAAEIEERFLSARSLANQGQWLASFLVAWSCAEPLLRQISGEEQEIKRPTPLLLLTKKLFTTGAIPRPVHDALVAAAKVRSYAVHGVSIEGAPIDEILVSRLLRACESLLSTQAITGDQQEEDGQVEQLVEWFFENYEDPANGVPYESAEGGYQYIAGGPYDPQEELSEHFPDASPALIEEALKRIHPLGFEWVKKGEY